MGGLGMVIIMSQIVTISRASSQFPVVSPISLCSWLDCSLYQRKWRIRYLAARLAFVSVLTSRQYVVKLSNSLSGINIPPVVYDRRNAQNRVDLY
jgi:hypothetical protein